MNEAPRKPIRFLTVEQAALELNVSEAAIRSLLRSGELCGFQVGVRGQWRTRPQDLQAYIDEAYRKVDEKIAWGEFAEAEAGTVRVDWRDDMPVTRTLATCMDSRPAPDYGLRCSDVSDGAAGERSAGRRRPAHW